jgi:hypothetical protein
MVRMVCLANSIRNDGRCVAGVDMATGEWVRPVPPGGGCIPPSCVTFGGRPLELLDIVELELAPPRFGTRYQRENRIVPLWNWLVVGRAAACQVLPYCEDTSPILFTPGDRVEPARLESLPPDRWQSLQLVRPEKVEFERNPWRQNRWLARFWDGAGYEYCLKVTDPVVSGRLALGEQIGTDCFLTVSLVEPWAPEDDESKPALCYKVVAGVIEI